MLRRKARVGVGVEVVQERIKLVVHYAGRGGFQYTEQRGVYYNNEHIQT
jgi:hypothetical protein